MFRSFEWFAHIRGTRQGHAGLGLQVVARHIIRAILGIEAYISSQLSEGLCLSQDDQVRYRDTATSLTSPVYPSIKQVMTLYVTPWTVIGLL